MHDVRNKDILAVIELLYSRTAEARDGEIHKHTMQMATLFILEASKQKIPATVVEYAYCAFYAPLVCQQQHKKFVFRYDAHEHISFTLFVLSSMQKSKKINIALIRGSVAN